MNVDQWTPPHQGRFSWSKDVLASEAAGDQAHKAKANIDGLNCPRCFTLSMWLILTLSQAYFVLRVLIFGRSSWKRASCATSTVSWKVSLGFIPSRILRARILGTFCHHFINSSLATYTTSFVRFVFLAMPWITSFVKCTWQRPVTSSLPFPSGSPYLFRKTLNHVYSLIKGGLLRHQIKNGYPFDHLLAQSHCLIPCSRKLCDLLFLDSVLAFYLAR